MSTARTNSLVPTLLLVAALSGAALLSGCLAPDSRGGGGDGGRVVTETGFALCFTDDEACAGGLRCDDDEGNGQCVPVPEACDGGPATCDCAAAAVCDDGRRCAEEADGARLVCSPFEGGIEGEGEAGDPDDDPVDPVGDPNPDLPDDWLTCEIDAECVTVEAGCCDHCNGGSLVAVNRDHEADADAALPAGDCGTIACTLLACADGEAECRNGRCAVVGQPDPDPIPDPDPEPDPDPDPDPNPDPVVEPVCSALSRDECMGEDEHCRTLMGIPEELACADPGGGGPREYGGCADVELACPAVEACGSDPETGRTLIFPGGCIPEGWERCDYCPDEGPDEIPDENGDGWDDRWFACDDDADCTVIETQCCDHCNGGLAMAVNLELVEEARNGLANKDCGGIACTQMACAPAEAFCGPDNSCLLAEGEMF